MRACVCVCVFASVAIHIYIYTFVCIMRRRGAVATRLEKHDLYNILRTKTRVPRDYLQPSPKILPLYTQTGSVFGTDVQLYIISTGLGRTVWTLQRSYYVFETSSQSYIMWTNYSLLLSLSLSLRLSLSLSPFLFLFVSPYLSFSRSPSPRLTGIASYKYMMYTKWRIV